MSPITVRDIKGHLVAGATVKVSGGGVSSTSKKTNSRGKVTFKLHAKTQGGKVTFMATKSGFQAGTLTLNVL